MKIMKIVGVNHSTQGIGITHCYSQISLGMNSFKYRCEFYQFFSISFLHILFGSTG
jgi:hypothetical protein